MSEKSKVLSSPSHTIETSIWSNEQDRKLTVTFFSLMNANPPTHPLASTTRGIVLGFINEGRIVKKKFATGF